MSAVIEPEAPSRFVPPNARPREAFAWSGRIADVLARPFVGLSLVDFTMACERVGLTVRIVRENGKSGGATLKYVAGRVNVGVVNGVVVEMDGVG
jgi:hypothetical protein